MLLFVEFLCVELVFVGAHVRVTVDGERERDGGKMQEAEVDDGVKRH